MDCYGHCQPACPTCCEGCRETALWAVLEAMPEATHAEQDARLEDAVVNGEHPCPEHA